ncbi:hypothetical protein ACWED2_09760 [Amycolatopsis sp. NPDC005003]
MRSQSHPGQQLRAAAEAQVKDKFVVAATLAPNAPKLGFGAFSVIHIDIQRDVRHISRSSTYMNLA